MLILNGERDTIKCVSVGGHAEFRYIQRGRRRQSVKNIVFYNA
jgi:hypothetical protein